MNLIVTSPPYLGIVNYAKQNWIRSWLLNKDPLEVSANLDDDLNLSEWIKFSKQFIVELKSFLKQDGVAVFVIGDVAKSKTSVIPLAREFCYMIKDNQLFKNIWCFSDVIGDSDKTTRIWGETKGSATATDRIVILSDINPFEKYSQKEGIEILDFDLIQNITEKFISNG
ncbi:MAG: DNA methyltransferase [Chitinophagaceae bacterium]